MRTGLADLRVAIVSLAMSYPADPPFHPPEIYPEYPCSDRGTDPGNGVYSMVRESLWRLGMDSDNYGAPTWNPLGKLISPGQQVLIKPNFVLHFNAGHGPLDAVVTHTSILRAIVDYVVIALENRGRILIGDAPQMNCDFDRLLDALGARETFAFIQRECEARGISFAVIDFRREQTCYKHGIVWTRKRLPGSAAVKVTLGRESLMEPIDCARLYGADYHRRQTISAHNHHRHEYLIAKEALSSDVVISVPKLKVHRKVGTTLNLKNMVGINTEKNNISHYRIGGPAAGGDEFSAPLWDDAMERRLSDALLGVSNQLGKYPFLAWRALRKLYRRFLRSSDRPAFTYGNWHGNDTAWRMVLDLNRILLTASLDGVLRNRPDRRYLSIVDGIIGGEGEGPLAPDAYRSGVLLAGSNPVAVDWTATRLMGLDPYKISLYAGAVDQMREWVAGFGPESIEIVSNIFTTQEVLLSEVPVFRFRVPAGWAGRVELYSVLPEVPRVGAEEPRISQ